MDLKLITLADKTDDSKEKENEVFLNRNWSHGQLKRWHSVN